MQISAKTILKTAREKNIFSTENVTKHLRMPKHY